MRFFVYLLMVLAGFAFFVYKQETPTSEVRTQTSPVENVKASTSPTEPNSAASTTPEKPKPTIKTPPPIDPQTLQLIQQKIGEASKSLENLKTVDTPPVPRVKLSQQELYNKAQTRIVNFFCQEGGQVRTASGIIISPKGYILTNAHVTEGFDSNFECLIRQGSPARNLGYAKPVMFPQTYAQATQKEQQLKNDAAIWKLTRGPGDPPGLPLPNSFPYYEIDPNFYPEIGQPLVTFSYPAELLGYETLLKSLYMLFGEATVSQMDQNFILSSTSLSSQAGSSGGIMVDVYTGEMVGLIFAVSQEKQINQRNLLSLNNNSINRIVQTEIGLSLQNFLNQ